MENAVSVAISVIGSVGVFLLLHGLLLWEDISPRRVIIGWFHKRKRKQKAHPLSDTAMRMMERGAVITVLAAVARCIYEIGWDQDASTGFRPVIVGLLTVFLGASLAALSTSRETLRANPQLWTGMQEAAQGTGGLLGCMVAFIALQNPFIVGFAVSIQLALPAVILGNVLYYRRKRRWNNELIP
jgi:hypothetical protein